VGELGRFNLWKRDTRWDILRKREIKRDILTEKGK
jgi:hypothetical protein